MYEEASFRSPEKLQEGSKKVFTKHMLRSWNLPSAHPNIKSAHEAYIDTTARSVKMDFSHCHLLSIPLPTSTPRSDFSVNALLALEHRQQ